VDANGDKIHFSQTVGNPLQNSVFENKISYFIDVKSIYKRDKFTLSKSHQHSSLTG